MIAGVADAGEEALRGDVVETLAEEVLRHQAPGGRGARAEGQTHAFQRVGQLVGTRETGGCVSDEVAHEGIVLAALSQCLGARDQTPGLHAGKAAEPGQLDLVVTECGDRGAVGLHRHVLHLDPEALLEVVGHLAEALDQTRLVLVGNGGEAEGLGGGTLREQGEGEGGQGDTAHVAHLWEK